MTQRATKAQLCGAGLLAGVVIAIIAVAFRGSWGALRDAALSTHFDHNAADLYPFAVDGLLVIAIIAAVLLRNDRVARWYSLGIIGSYTVASWAINFMHGLGWFGIDPATGRRAVPPWPVVMLIASLLIGSIFLGSHLLTFVGRHIFPNSPAAVENHEPSHDATPAYDDATPVAPVPANKIEAARTAFRASLAPDRQRLSQQSLADRYGISVRQARAVQDDVKREQEEAADEWAAETVAIEAARYTPNGSVADRDGAGGR
jgi:hypothetical protein